MFELSLSSPLLLGEISPFVDGFVEFDSRAMLVIVSGQCQDKTAKSPITNRYIGTPLPLLFGFGFNPSRDGWLC